MKVGFFTRKIDGVMGGMERQMLLIASRLIEYGFDVSIVSLDAKSPKTYFTSDSKIKFIYVPATNSEKRASIQERIIRQFKVFKVIKDSKFDIVVSFSTGAFWYSVLPAKLNRTKIVLAERNGPSVYSLTKSNKYKHLIFLGMTLCNAITVQFPSYIQSYPFYLHNRIKVIPNEVPTFGKSKQKVTAKKFLTFGFLGRFCYQKQTLELVEAFLEFSRSNRNAKLILIGEGDQLHEIKNLIDMNFANDIISVTSSKLDIENALRDVDVLIHPSLWEGFPNSVAEALALGIPVAGFSDCEGIRDLVTDGKNGWLIDRPNVSKPIVNLLNRVMSEEREKIQSMGHHATGSVQKYSKEFSMENWKRLISEI